MKRAYGFDKNLAHNSPPNRSKLQEAGMVDAALCAMRAAPADARLQRAACWSLLTLAASDAAAREVSEKGGIAAVVAAMTNCSESDSVQHFGCWAIANVAWVASSTANDHPAATKGPAAEPSSSFSSAVPWSSRLSPAPAPSGSLRFASPFSEKQPPRRASKRQSAGTSAAAAARAQGAADACRIAARKFPHHGGIAEKAALALEKLQVAPSADY